MADDYFKRIKTELQEIDRDPPQHMTLGPQKQPSAEIVEECIRQEWGGECADVMAKIICEYLGEIDLFNLFGTLLGPEDSPYDEGVFFFEIKIPQNYPFVPPKIRFTTKIYHCNIDEQGKVCLPTLFTNNWTPALTLSKVMHSLYALLISPNWEEPMIPKIATLYRYNRKEHDKIAKEWTIKYAQ